MPMQIESIRTCLGCGKRKAKELLWRFTVNAAGIIMEDGSGMLGGRGAYCCKEKSCLKRFKKNRNLSKALRAQVLGWDEELRDIFGSEE